MSDKGSDAPKTAMQIAASLADDLYKDGAQPSVQTMGQALNGIFKAVAHYPRLWGIMSDVSLEEKERQFKEKLLSKVNAIPDGKKVLPKPNILGPSVQALEYGIFEDHLSEMFANLISGAMSSETSDMVHPSFVEIIKQMTQGEAKVLKYLSDRDGIHGLVDVIDGSGRYIARNFFGYTTDILDDPERTYIHLDNLLRLKLIDVEVNDVWKNKNFGTRYDTWFEAFKVVKTLEGAAIEPIIMRRKVLFLSEYGRSFVKVCLEAPESTRKE